LTRLRGTKGYAGADGTYETLKPYHFKKLVAEIGVPDCRVHDLRHTFAVLSLQNGDDIKTVQGNLGHATAAFTLDVYGHVSERMKDDSAARMEAYIKGL
jgi:integrase